MVWVKKFACNIRFSLNIGSPLKSPRPLGEVGVKKTYFKVQGLSDDSALRASCALRAAGPAGFSAWPGGGRVRVYTTKV